MGKLENQVIALRCGAVEWTRLRKGRDGWERDDDGRQALPEGQDLLHAAGSEPTPEIEAALAAAAHAMAGHHATVVLPGTSAIQRIVSLPASDPAELAGMVDLQIDTLSPFPPETVDYSFEVLETGENASRVLIAAIQKTVVEAVGAAFRRHRLQIDRITLSTPGWWEMFRRRSGGEWPGRQVLLIAEKTACELVVADSGVPVLFRSLAISEGLSPADFAQDIAQETAYSLTALQLEHGDTPLSQITAWLAGDAPAELPALLQTALDRPVRTEPLDSMGSLSEGVARREEVPAGPRLDLVPETWRAERKNRLVKRRLAAASAMALAVWALGVVAVLGRQEFQSRRLAALTRELAAVKPAAQEVRDTRKRVQALNLYKNSERAALECLREIVSLMPTGVELGQFTFEKGKAIALSGQAPAPQPIYDFKKALDASALFFGTELQGPTRSMNRETFRLVISLQESVE